MPVVADAVESLLGAGSPNFDARAEACAEQDALTSRPPADGDCSLEYLRQLVVVHSHQAMNTAFEAALRN